MSEPGCGEERGGDLGRGEEGKVGGGGGDVEEEEGVVLNAAREDAWWNVSTGRASFLHWPLGVSSLDDGWFLRGPAFMWYGKFLALVTRYKLPHPMKNRCSTCLCTIQA